MYKSFRGYCPMYNVETTLHINYIDASTLSSSKYVKGVAECPYVKKSLPCNKSSECPIIKQAPQEISG